MTKIHKTILLIVVFLFSLPLFLFYALDNDCFDFLFKHEGEIYNKYAEPPPALIMIKEQEITPPHSQAAVRPDSILMQGSPSGEQQILVNYLQVEPGRIFRIARYDKDLSCLGSEDVYSGGDNAPTDARMCKIDGISFFYPFETTTFNPSAPNFLNIAFYSILGDRLQLELFKNNLAYGTPLIPPDRIPNKGDELTDDPLPLLYDNKIYIFTRKFESSFWHVRVFTSDFTSKIDEYDIDIDPKTKLTTTVGSIVFKEETPYLITGLFNAPPIQNGIMPDISTISSDIFAIPLSPDLKKTVGKKIPLANSLDYETYVSRAIYKDGIFCFLYDTIDLYRPGYHRGYLRVLDDNFKTIQTIQINEGEQLDNHMSLEILDDKLYVFYYNQHERLMAKIFQVK